MILTNILSIQFLLGDKRSPRYEALKKQSYQAGCFGLSELNISDSYDVSSEDCVYR